MRSSLALAALALLALLAAPAAAHSGPADPNSISCQTDKAMCVQYAPDKLQDNTFTVTSCVGVYAPTRPGETLPMAPPAQGPSITYYWYVTLTNGDRTYTCRLSNPRLGFENGGYNRDYTPTKVDFVMEGAPPPLPSAG